MAPIDERHGLLQYAHMESTTTLAPGFLIASPHMKDGFFERTVVLLAEHMPGQGAFGIVINRPTPVGFAEVLSQMDITFDDADLRHTSAPVLSGGPVDREFGWVIHSLDWHTENTHRLGDLIGITASRRVLEDIAVNAGPQHFIFCLGYAGWGPDQLMGEVHSGAWLSIPLETDLVFHTDAESRWQTAISRLGFDPFELSPSVGDA